MIQTFLDSLSHFPLLSRFAIWLAVCLFVPRLCQRVRLPAAVGLLLAGVPDETRTLEMTIEDVWNWEPALGSNQRRR